MLPQLLDPRPYFAHLPDPRRETQNKLHNLHDILMMAQSGFRTVEDGSLCRRAGATLYGFRTTVT